MNRQEARLIAKNEGQWGGWPESYIENKLRVTYQKFFKGYSQQYLKWVEKEQNREHTSSIHNISEIKPNNSLESSNLDNQRYFEEEPSFDPPQQQFPSNPITRSQLRPQPTSNIIESQIKDKQRSQIKMKKKNQISLHITEPAKPKQPINKPTNTEITQKFKKITTEDSKRIPNNSKQDQMKKVTKQQEKRCEEKQDQSASKKEIVDKKIKAVAEKSSEEDIKLGDDQEIYSGIVSSKGDESASPIKSSQKSQEQQVQIVEEEEVPSYYDLITMQSQMTVNSQSSGELKKGDSLEIVSNKEGSRPSSFEVANQQNNSQDSPKIQQDSKEDKGVIFGSNRLSMDSPSKQLSLNQDKSLVQPQYTKENKQQDKLLQLQKSNDKAQQEIRKQLRECGGDNEIPLKSREQQSLTGEKIQQQRQDSKNISQSNIQHHKQEQAVQQLADKRQCEANPVVNAAQSQNKFQDKDQIVPIQYNIGSQLAPAADNLEQSARYNETFLTAEQLHQNNQFQSFIHQEQQQHHQNNPCDLQPNADQPIFNLENLLNLQENQDINKRVENIVDKFISQLEQETFCGSCAQNMALRQSMEKESLKLKIQVEEVKRDNLRFKEINLTLMKKLEKLEQRVKQLQQQNFLGSSKINHNKHRRQRSQQLVNQNCDQEPKEKKEEVEKAQQPVSFSVEYESEKNSSDEEDNNEAQKRQCLNQQPIHVASKKKDSSSSNSD